MVSICRVKIVAGKIGVDDILTAHRRIECLAIQRISFDDPGVLRHLSVQLTCVTQIERKLYVLAAVQHLDRPAGDLATCTYDQYPFHDFTICSR